MKRATGNSTGSAKNNVSIQLKLGGHSFSVDSLPSDVTGGTSSVVFEVETHKVTLVPQAEFDESLSAYYLDAAGLACDDDETAVCSEPQYGIVAVMAVNRKAYDEINGVFGAMASFTTPLLAGTEDTHRRLMSLRVCDGVCYMVYTDDGLKLAEAIRTDSTDDVLFYVHRMAEILSIGSDVPVLVSGDKAVADTLKRYFKEVECA